MKRVEILVLILLSCTVGVGQQVELRGKVSIHNSKYNSGKIQYVNDAFITAPFTKSGMSDSEGNFQLNFVGQDPGLAIPIKAEKSGYEVVNQYDLQQVIIGRKLPLGIYLTTEGLLAEAQTELYNIAKSQQLQQKDALIAKLRLENAESEAIIQQLEARFGRDIKDRFEAETVLLEKFEALQRELPKYALELAKKNLDFASAQYIEAYEFFKNGEIEKAIKTLDDSKIQALYSNALTNISKGEELQKQGAEQVDLGYEQINQVIELQKLKATNLMIAFRSVEAIAVYESLIDIYKNIGSDQLELARIYDKLSMAYFYSGDFNKALQIEKSAVAIKREFGENVKLGLAESLHWLANIQESLDLFNDAEQNNLEAIEIREAKLSPNDGKLADSYNNLSGVYRRKGDLDKSLQLAERATKIWEASGAYNVVYGYNRMGLTLKAKGEPEASYNYFKKAVDIYEKVHGTDHRMTAAGYNNLAYALMSLNRTQEALDYQMKAIAILEKDLDESHPYIGKTYLNLGSAYKDIGENEKARKLLLKALQILESRFGPEYSDVATANGHLGFVAYQLGEFDKAVSYQEKSLKIRQKIYDPNHADVGTSHLAMGIIYQGAGALEKAEFHLKRALEIRLNLYGTTHGETLASRSRLASLYEARIEYESALEQTMLVYEIDKKSSGPSNPYTMDGCLNIVRFNILLKNHEDAKKYYQIAAEQIDSVDERFKESFEQRLQVLEKEIEKIRN